MIEAIRLLGKVPLVTGSGETAAAKVAALNLEISLYGYTLDAGLAAALRRLDPARFAIVRDQLASGLQALSGATDNHQRLFVHFPYDTPRHHALLREHVENNVWKWGRDEAVRLVILDCGHVVDSALFPLERYGGCPLCGTALARMGGHDGERAPLERATPLKMLGFLDDDAAREAAASLLARPSSLSSDERAFVLTARRLNPPLPAEPFRETVPLIFGLTDAARVRPYIRTATDILRLAVFMSDPAADLSLAEPVKFKLSRSEKKALLSLLDAIASPEEDMLRHRERWLRLGERINPGAEANRRRYPNAARAFDALRNAPGRIATFNRAIEPALRARRVDDRLLALLASRPGEFARRIDLLLRSANNRDLVFQTLPQVLPALPTRRLFELIAAFRVRGRTGYRLFLPKGSANKAQVEDDRRASIDHREIIRLFAFLHEEIGRRLATLPPLGDVQLDPRLGDLVAPFGQRGDSLTSIPVTKGSAYPFAGDVTRLFVHWTGNIDVDLSILLLDPNLQDLGHVAYTNLSHYGCVHSGDVQSAPDGASEFIDFDRTLLLSLGARYVVSSIISYRGDKFATFPCYAGFMQRDRAGSGAVYEPETVQLRFDVNARSTSHLPLIFDLEARQVIFADLSSGAGFRQNVATGLSKHVALTRAVLDMRQSRTTLLDIAEAHVQARGRLADAGEAHRIIGPQEAMAMLREQPD